MPSVTINRRVLHLGGYDPMPAAVFFARFQRELARFATCWNLTASTRDYTETQASAAWTVDVSGPGWQVITRHELVRWDDVIAAHRAGSVIGRLGAGWAAFFDFLRHGALGRYLAVAWRYAGFFLFPYLAMALVLAGSLFVAGWLLPLIGLPQALGWLAGLVAGLGIIVWLASRTVIGHLLDDWIFASEIVRATDPVIEDRLKAAAIDLARTPASVDCLVVGHSLGALLAAELLDQALAAPAPQGTRRFGYLALGSSLLKIALHGKAIGLKARLQRLIASGRIDWTEYQSLSDVMNFYKSDPVKVLGLDGPSPLVRQVRFSRMLKPAYYRTIKLDFFRLHCQFISGNDMRAPFDYLMTICGPFSPVALATSKDGAQGWIGLQGELTLSDPSPLLAGQDRSGSTSAKDGSAP
ncbi:MAG: hypothetical protein MUC44_09590 [Beijerinckiaceae bacterium]|jgi:hypothetical protein|nr:hypothetical protein [Beijerinckiaceae bacterium]